MLHVSKRTLQTLPLPLLLAACSGDVLQDPTPTPPAPTQPAPQPEPMPDPDWTPPPIWGAERLEDLNPDPNVVEVNLRAEMAEITLADGTVIDGYAYNGTWPGPLLHAKVGDEVIVHFENQLPEPTTVHWHGLRIPDDMDGSPRVQAPVEPGGTFEYRFVVRDAGSFWYHPHVRSNEQVEKGLYGSLIVREPDLPEFDVERIVTLDDILLDDSGALRPFLASHPEIMHGRQGNVLLTNGNPETQHLTVEQEHVELWRIVNTANARTMSISIDGAHAEVVGTDGGRLPEPYWAGRIQIPVGQRYDVLVRYDRSGTVVMNSHVLVRNSAGEVVEAPIPLIEIDVQATGLEFRPLFWFDVAERPEREVDQEVTIELNGENRNGEIVWTLNGQAHAEEPLFTFQEGQTVRIELVNRAGPEHPFHLHGQFFEVLSGIQPGLKDTVLVPGLQTVVIKAYLDNPGRWMAHCHILEHAELGMMSEIVVEPRD